MGYRGEDLDLRTPQTWSAPPADFSGRAPAGRGGAFARGPIWVDDTVLASCNHAFDVALAHRAGEVRLEHLLYALTRIDAAAETLEKHGVRVAALRRESATLIASDIPVGLPNGKGVPRRAESVEEALRLAAAESLRRNAPASVDDLLHVLLDVRPDLPGLGLLARHTVRVARDLPEPLPPLTRTPAYEPRYVEPVEPQRERVRMPAGSYYVTEPARPLRTELAASTADTIQNSRIEALEQMVRALSHDLAGERKAFAGLLQDMQRDVVAQRDDASRLGGGLYDRLQSLEHLVTASRGDGGGAQMHERLQSFEIGLEKRLSDLSRSWTLLSDRLQGLEQSIHGLRTSGQFDLGTFSDRIAGIERVLAQAAADTGRQWSGTTDKLKALELALASKAEPVLDLSPVSDRLDVIEEALLSQDGGGVAEIGERLAGIERLVQSQRAEIIAETEVLKSDVSTLARSLAALPAEGERLKVMASLFDHSRGEVVAAVTGPLLQRVNVLSSAVETRQSENAAMIAQIGDRLASVERALTAAVQRTEQSHKVYAQELGEVHEALVKLNTNQHTLAGTIDQWRTQGATELSLIGNRIGGLERETAKPLQMLEQMSVSMEAMHKITVARYHRRNRFWYWLLGTDDWVAASWPSQLAKLEAERSLVKPVRR